MKSSFDKSILESNLFNNKSCPLCKTNNCESRKSIYLNVYSELIAEYLEINEKKLLAFCNFQICLNCSLYYWENQLSEKLRNSLYSEIIPVHPKGIDSTGKFFSYEGLITKIKNAKNDLSQIRRILDGYLLSFKFKNDDEKEIYSKAILNFDELKNKELLQLIFKRGPKSLSRHAGFRETILNKYILENIEKGVCKNYQYIEYGSPNWGPINPISEMRFKCLNIIPNISIFWNSSNNNSIGLQKFNVIHEKNIFLNEDDFYGSTLGLILILDHIEEPLIFLKKFINVGIKSIIIIVEKININKGLPIQHLTGWSVDSLSYLAKNLGLNINFIDDNNANYIFAVFNK